MRKGFFVWCVVFTAGLLVLTIDVVRHAPDGKLHLVFCNVGQGDAIFIRGPKGSTVLVDGGPDKRVLECLGKNMSFINRTIDLIVLSHPQADHLVGLIEIVRRYDVKQIVNGSANKKTKEFLFWEDLVRARKIPTSLADKDMEVLIDKQVKIKILSPDLKNLARCGPEYCLTDENDLSTVGLVSFKNFKALLTGDAGLLVLRSLVPSFSSLSILKVSHHGSKTGLDEKLLEELRPELSVISVGKNSYGHPGKEVIGFFEKLKLQYLRTDKAGDISISTSGDGLTVLSK